MSIMIQATTAAKISNPFRVLADKPVSVVAFGLAGAETAVIQIATDGQNFEDVKDSSATMTATENQTSIIKGGLYRISKSATAAPAGVSVD